MSSKERMLGEIVRGMETLVVYIKEPEIILINGKIHIKHMSMFEVDEMDQVYKTALHLNGWFYDMDLCSWFYTSSDNYMVIANWEMPVDLTKYDPTR